jgi:hypothetical protein
MAIMFGSLIALKVTSAGDKEKPKPTPQMMAPRPAPSDSGRASYALIDSSHVGTGWANN